MAFNVERRERDRLRQEIDEETRTHFGRRTADRRCGTLVEDLAGFDRRLLRRHGLLPAPRPLLLCGTFADTDGLSPSDRSERPETFPRR